MKHASLYDQNWKLQLFCFVWFFNCTDRWDWDIMLYTAPVDQHSVIHFFCGQLNELILRWSVKRLAVKRWHTIRNFSACICSGSKGVLEISRTKIKMKFHRRRRLTGFTVKNYDVRAWRRRRRLRCWWKKRGNHSLENVAFNASYYEIWHRVGGTLLALGIVRTCTHART